ncbi:MAG: dockerin type I repeat-containing protein [Clostridia bacterium]|nr:dockerin type I repeat-containing protein [Clostridia bacterium]
MKNARLIRFISIVQCAAILMGAVLLLGFTSRVGAASPDRTIDGVSLYYKEFPHDGTTKSSLVITCDEDHFLYRGINSITGTFGAGNTFIAGNTYHIEVKLESLVGYRFADPLTATLSGRAGAVSSRSVSNNSETVYVGFDIRINSDEEIECIKISFDKRLPVVADVVSDYVNMGVTVLDPNQKDASVIRFTSVYYNWESAGGSGLDLNDRFSFGKEYRKYMSFKLEGSTVMKFSENTALLLNKVMESRYRVEVVNCKPTEINYYLYISPVFPGYIGESEDYPVDCYSFSDFKEALENPAYKYVRLNDVSGEAGKIPNIKGSGKYYPITTSGEKVIEIAGNASFEFEYESGFDRYYLQPVAFISINDTTTIRGDGSLTYLAPRCDEPTLLNALINNRSALTVEGGVKLTERTTHVNNPVAGSSIYQGYSGASLTVNGAEFLTNRFSGMENGVAAVKIEAGRATINAGYFKCEKGGNDTKTIFGLVIASTSANVRINGGQFEKMLLPAGKFPEDYIDDDRALLIDGVEYSHTESVQIQKGTVTVRSLSSSVAASVNSPSPSSHPGDTVYFPYDNNSLHYKVTGLQWYDETASRLIPYDEYFTAGHRYSVTFHVYADDFIRFKASGSTPSVSVTVNGKSASVSKSPNSSASEGIVVRADLGTCPWILDCVSVAVIKPRAGMSASSVGSTDSAHCEVLSNSSEWYDITAGRFLSTADKFIAGHKYRAVIWVKASGGYTFKTDSSLNPDVTGKVNGIEVPVNTAFEQDAREIVELTCEFECADSLPGDVNEDGEVNLKDATLVRRYYVGGWNVSINTANADVDNNGTINLKDATLIRRYYVGGWGVALIKN